jgi:hypothetical protein
VTPLPVRAHAVLSIPNDNVGPALLLTPLASDNVGTTMLIGRVWK